MANPVSAAFDMIARMFGWSQDRSRLKNSEAMQGNANAREEERARRKATDIAAGDDLEAKRKAASGGFIKPLTMAMMLAVASSGCTTTVRPKPIPSTVIDFDGNFQDAGVLGQAPDGRVIVSELVRERYNRLLEVYGEEFVPTRHKDQGVTPAAISPTRGQTWYMDKAAEAAYYLMVGWERKR